MRKSLLCLLLNFFVIAPQIANAAEEALLGAGNLAIKIDGLVKSPNLSWRTWSGIQNILKSLDSGLRRNDALKEFQTFYETIKVDFIKFTDDISVFLDKLFWCQYAVGCRWFFDNYFRLGMVFKGTIYGQTKVKAASYQ